MMSNKIPTMGQTPSGIAMPISAASDGTGLGMATRTGLCAAPTYLDARDRHVAGVAIAQGAFPGSTAWSPPTC